MHVCLGALPAGGLPLDRPAVTGGTSTRLHSSNAPVIGRRDHIATLPVSDNCKTILTTAHDLTDDPHLAMLGAQPRHPSDMGDIEETCVVLLGAQNVWNNGTIFAYQAAPFMRGELVRLRPVCVLQAFQREITLSPGNLCLWPRFLSGRRP